MQKLIIMDSLVIYWTNKKLNIKKAYTVHLRSAVASTR